MREGIHASMGGAVVLQANVVHSARHRVRGRRCNEHRFAL